MPADISVVVPLLNEEENVYELYNRLSAALRSTGATHEMIFVDDGSTDHTLPLIEKIAAEDPFVKFISFSRNFGHQPALYAGIEKSTGKHIVLIDGDLQDPPEAIPGLWSKLQEGYDTVYAKRKRRKGESIIKKLTASFFYRLLNRITSIHIPVDTGDFRIFNRNVATELMKMNDHHKFLRGQIAWLGFKETALFYDREERKRGNTGFGYAKMFRFAFDGITGFSNFPLKFASISGIIVSLLSFFLILYVLWAKLVLGQTISGWASIMVAVLFLGGIQLLSVGIIGEYISRINDNVRNRQLYVIRKSNIENRLPDAP